MSGQLRVNNITDEAGTGSPNFPNGLDATTLNDLAYPNASSMGFRNRIINGGMVIDQRNNGASVTVPSGGTSFAVDRTYVAQSTDGVITAQRSTVAPPGFTNSLLVTATTGDASLASNQYVLVRHIIEGLNVADLAWGTASAVTVTVSFLVRASATGTFTGTLKNSAQNRAYPFSYTISAPNAWEQKSITISGDTSGTWLTDNGVGIILDFGVALGSSFLSTAGAWGNTGAVGATGQVNGIASNGATFYITGVQLEAGSVATPFERRPFGTELMLCQRYFEKSYDINVVPGTNTADGIVMVDTYYSNARFIATHVPLMVPKRISNWTLTYWDRVGNLSRTSEYSSATWTDNLSSSGTFLVSQGQNRFLVYPSNTNDNAGFHFTASAEL